MTPEQKLAFIKRQFWILFGASILNCAAGFYVIGKQDKELKKMKIAFRTMSDVAGMYEEYAPGEVIAKGNEKLAFAMIEIKYDE